MYKVMAKFNGFLVLKCEKKGRCYINIDNIISIEDWKGDEGKSRIITNGMHYYGLECTAFEAMQAMSYI